MRRFLTIAAFVVLAVLSASAQKRIPCDRSLLTSGTRGGSDYHGVRVSKTTGRVRIPVILAAFNNQGFSVPDNEIKAYWDALLNQEGYSEHGAAGCVADYFKKQSGGLFEPVFDVIGPVMLPETVRYYGKNRAGKAGEDTNAEGMVYDACVAANIDFAPYSWSGDTIVDVVMVVFAGPGENRGGLPENIWPHKNYLTWKELDGMELTQYACVSELRNKTALDGYGTFVHEFSHCMGLPDLYPISNSAVYSYFDEWDLMDGGNYIHNGFSPPNYSALERWICDWYDFKELTAPATISDMPAWDDEPVAYVIRNDDNSEEYYILENRQQRGYDFYVPGNGLLVTHVTGYTKGDLFPNSASSSRIRLIYADNRNYRESEAFFGSDNHFTTDGHSNYLSLSAYPYIVGDSLNNHLTKASIPAMQFDKPITNITMDAEGRISFDFMKEGTGIDHSVTVREIEDEEVWFDLQGRRLPCLPQSKGIYIVRKGKSVNKVYKP